MSRAKPKPWTGPPSAEATTLQQLVERRLGELQRSYREAAAIGGVSRSVLHTIVQGRGERRTEDSLRGVAKAIDVPLRRVREVAPEQPYTRKPREEYPLQQLIAARIAELDLTYREAAALTGLSQALMHRIATGVTRHKHSQETLEGIARGLRLPLAVVEDAYRSR